ncbi:hypothetical protein [Streptomyces sp. NBC_00199]|jgi:hypothetical protein|uniref:hypothetical protein n=1 Tax=Streptomyces sp. NBC_00199 TaxID=2975678 RepID=UPI00224E53CA|nr:hypothetical protein [Streptomyces sp. NBC_00199]MCX5264690.1 hypothetical protein [Streptomyces sp. NBC_00199]
MRIRRAAAATAAAMMLAGGGVLISSGAAHAAPAACHTEIRYVPMNVLRTMQVFENGHWVTKTVTVTVIMPISTVVCD